MAKKKRVVKSKSNSITRSNRSKSVINSKPESLIQVITKKRIAMNFFIWVLLTAGIVYGIYHLIVIDTLEGIQIILGIIVLGILIKVARWLISKLRKKIRK